MRVYRNHPKIGSDLVAVVVRFEGSVLRDSKVFSLVFGKFGKLDSKGVQVTGSYLLVKLLGQEVNSNGVLARVHPQVQLGQDLVGE